MIRLLNIHTMEFKAFDNADDVPPYAAASHRWQGDETTFEDFVNHRQTDSLGYQKILSFCNCMREEASFLKIFFGTSLNWLWIDTCCIKKSDSSELSEAMKSMFDWYTRAHVCLAYLVDVGRYDIVAQSGWFKRGWTLQELLAPNLVVFLDKEWQIRGHRKDVAFGDISMHDFTSPIGRHGKWPGPELNRDVSVWTGIDPRFLFDHSQIGNAKFYDVLKWMESRPNTRWEDRAYCLLGVLNVSMSPDYGEREFAMTRLLEQVRDGYERRLRTIASGRSQVTQTKPAEILRTEITLIGDLITQWYEQRERRRDQDRRRGVLPQHSTTDNSLDNS